MSKTEKTLEFKFERMIPASAEEVFEGWLSPKIPGTVWNAAEKFLMDAKVDGLFFWRLKGTSHYGRFTEFQRNERIQHTWMSPHTSGEESLVTVTFEKRGSETLMTLVHSGLPDTEGARGHKDGWAYFTGLFMDQFGGGSKKSFDWEQAKTCGKK